MVQGQAMLQKLAAYVADHPDARPDDPVEDPDLTAAGIKKFSDVTSDIRSLTKLNTAYELRSMAFTLEYNRITTKLEANHNTIEDTDIAKPNGDRLLDQ
jgi:hypothetical protein